ncbi:hypothetical protein JW835_14510 [bacterium]|nr:hypothetical protein [bacterium]
MCTHKKIWLISGFVFLLAVQILAGEYQIVVNASFENQTITEKMLKNIFLGKQTKWGNGQRVLPVMLQEGEARNAFIKNIIKKTPIAFKNYWNTALFTGRGVPPVAFENEEDLIHYIQKNPGAIGFISEETSAENVKVLQIEP